ncbi:MAG: hypothetical protein ACE365_00955 [Gammaproteobacteria bacterium]
MRNLLVVIVCLFLSACGFHLSGDAKLPTQMQKTAITSKIKYSPLTRELAQSIKSTGTQVVDDPSEANTIIQFIAINESNNLATSGTTQETRKYTLTSSATLQVADKKGGVIYGPFTLSESASQYLYAGQVISNSEESVAIYRGLRRELVRKIMFKLSSQELKTALVAQN